MTDTRKSSIWTAVTMTGFVLVLLLLAFGPMGCGPSGTTQAPTTGEISITPKATTAAPAASPTGPELAQTPVIKSAAGRRDPFIPVVFRPSTEPVRTKVPEKMPAATGGPAKIVKPTIMPLAMTVTGIVKMGSTYLASVSGVKSSSIAVGDTLDSGFRVKSITVSTVVLTKEGKNFPYSLTHPEDQSSQGGQGSPGGAGSARPGAPPPPVPAP